LRALSPVLPTIGVIVACVLALLSIAAHATLGTGGIAAAIQRTMSKVPIASVRRWADRRREAFTHADRCTVVLSRAPLPTKLRILAPLVLHWIVEAFDAWLLLALLGVRVRFGDAFAFDATVSWIRTVAFVAPAGLGVTDATTLEYFRALGLSDAAIVAAAFVLLRRARDLFWIVVGYVILARASTTTRAVATPPSDQCTSNSIDAIDV
jgi:uncharacterized membrane protein YbhN (UPF0104 family)